MDIDQSTVAAARDRSGLSVRLRFRDRPSIIATRTGRLARTDAVITGVAVRLHIFSVES